MAGISWYQNNGSSTKTSSAENTLYSLADVQLRFLCPDDLDEVRALCQDWFPIEYPLTWYEDITSSTSRFYALAAIYNRVIIGLIVAEIKPYSSVNFEDFGILAKSFVQHCEIGYILSLGVSKEFRRNGIASLLLDSLINNLTTVERKRIKAIFLHVLTTNSAAIMFYESRKFRLHCFLPYYYSINGRCKDGFTYVLYINDGHPPWTAYDYLRFVCESVVSGGGLFPWLLGGVSRALHWLWWTTNNTPLVTSSANNTHNNCNSLNNSCTNNSSSHNNSRSHNNSNYSHNNSHNSHNNTVPAHSSNNNTTANHNNHNTHNNHNASLQH